MSLLESLVSLVILALSAVGFLGAFQQSARSIHDAELWLRGSQIAEAAMEARKSGLALPPNEAGFETTLVQQPLPSGLVALEVAVRLPGGQLLKVYRVEP